MMRQQLQQENPNIFSLPGETEIKKHISKLFSQQKAGKSKVVDEQNSDPENHDEDNDSAVSMNEIEWKHILRRITMQHIERKPDFIYKEFLRVMSGEEGCTEAELPEKKKIKGKISYIKTSLKKSLKRSIV